MWPLLTGVATIAAGAGFAMLHAIAPRSQLYGETFIGTPGQGRKLALTYDDGPNDPDTPLLLDILAKHEVKATFFLIGKFVEKRPEIVRRIARAGHEIGNHTYSHPNLARVGDETEIRELLQCETSLLEAGVRSVTGSGISEIKPKNRKELMTQLQAARQRNNTRFFRPPFGLRRPSTLRIAREAGYTPVNWSVTCYDWKPTTADTVEKHALRQIKGGDVILMHDGGYKQLGSDRKHTLEATERLIKKYKSEGYEFVTVSGMMSG